MDKSSKSSKNPVCIMNASYSSGWCEESFGIPLTSLEITCRGNGDEKCTFIMAHPSKMKALLEQDIFDLKSKPLHEIPRFFMHNHNN